MNLPARPSDVASQEIVSPYVAKGLLPEMHNLLVADLEKSVGPLLCLAGEHWVFDLREQGAPMLGYNASPLFGVAQHANNWEGVLRTKDADSIRAAYENMVDRIDSPTVVPNLVDPSELHRNYITESILHQYPDQIKRITAELGEQLLRLGSKFSEWIFDPRQDGMRVEFGVRDPSSLQRLADEHQRYGLLVDMENARIRLTFQLGFRPHFLKLVWEQIEDWMAGRKPRRISPERHLTKVQSNYRFHRQLISAKRQMAGFHGDPLVSAVDYLRHELEELKLGSDLQFEVITPENYSKYRERILEMQSIVYEPARQTPAKEFDQLFDETLNNYVKKNGTTLSRPPIALVVCKQDKIIAMAFSGPLDRYECERGVTSDPYFDVPETYYMVDLTVAEEYRGQLGGKVKNAIALLATTTRVSALHGRNRDRLARGMWAINLSLGGYELQYLPEDYQDQQKHRDCIYYRCPLVSDSSWDTGELQSNCDSGNDETSPPFGVDEPLRGFQLNESFYHEHLSELLNGTDHDSTVTPEFLKALSSIVSRWPTSLQHVLATCHPQRAVGLATAATLPHSLEEPRVLAVHGFDKNRLKTTRVCWLKNPAESGRVQYLDELRYALEWKGLQLLIAEPMMRSSMDRMSVELLAETIDICRDARVPVLFDESAAMLYRHGEFFAPSHSPELHPDLVMADLGRGISILLCQKKYHRQLVCSGNSVELLGFEKLTRSVHTNVQAFQKAQAEFDAQVDSMLQGKATHWNIKNGVGWIEGLDASEPFKFLGQKNSSGRFLVCPTYRELQQFVAQ